MGQWLTYDLLSQGVEVTQFDACRNDDKASLAATGIQVIKGLLVSNDPIFAMKVQGHHRLKQLLESDFFARVPRLLGVYEPCATVEEFTRRKRRIFRRQLTSCFDAKVLHHGDQRLSGYCKKAAACFFYPSDYWFDPIALLKRFSEFHQTHPRFHLRQEVVRSVSPCGKVSSAFGDRVQFDHVYVAVGSNVFDFSEALGLLELRKASNYLPGWSISAKLGENMCSATKPKAVKQDTKSIVWDGENFIQGGFSTEKFKKLSCMAELPFEQLRSLMEDFVEELLTDRVLEQPIENSISLSKRLGVRIQCPGNKPQRLQLPNCTVITGLHKSGFSLAPVISQNSVQELLTRLR